MKLTEKEIALVEDIRKTVNLWGPAVREDCRWSALFDLVDRFIKEEPPQPEIKIIRTGMELTTEEWRAKDIVKSWVNSHGCGYSPESTIGNIAKLLTAIDRETSKYADYKKQEQETKPKVVFYSYGASAMYVDGKLVYNPASSFDCYSARRALEEVGYEAEIRSVDYLDMPPDPKGNGARGYWAPPTLAELEGHFNNLEQARRRTRIASLKDELQRLEQEDANA